ncbi:MAG: C4-type zinc ribbon domain-containing protein [Acidobacteriota bacterium]
MNSPLESIVALQSTLRRLAEVEARLNGIPDSMRELHEQHTARSAEIEALNSAAAEAGTERRVAEGAIADTQEKLQHFQQQISLVRTQREYAALLQEIDTAKSSVKGLEDQALQAFEREGKAQSELETQQEAFADTDKAYAVELKRWEAEKPSIAAEASMLKSQVSELEGQVAPALLSRFNRLLQRSRGDALAAIRLAERVGKGPQIWSCGACNFRVRPQVVVEIRNAGAILECDSCKRILYVAPEG